MFVIMITRGGVDHDRQQGDPSFPSLFPLFPHFPFSIYLVSHPVPLPSAPSLAVTGYHAVPCPCFLHAPFMSRTRNVPANPANRYSDSASARSYYTQVLRCTYMSSLPSLFLSFFFLCFSVPPSGVCADPCSALHRKTPSASVSVSRGMASMEHLSPDIETRVRVFVRMSVCCIRVCSGGIGVVLRPFAAVGREP